LPTVRGVVPANEFIPLAGFAQFAFKTRKANTGTLIAGGSVLAAFVAAVFGAGREQTCASQRDEQRKF
jgi:hypothetical protein